MSADDDVPTSAPPPAAPEATPAPNPAGSSAADSPSADASASPSPEHAGALSGRAGDQPPRRRRRRRRHGPRPEGIGTPPTGESVNARDTPAPISAPPPRPRLSLEAIAAGGEFTIAPSAPRDPSQRRRRRRRRPKFPRPDGVAAAPGSDGASAPAGEAQQQQARPERGRGPRRHGRGERRDGQRQEGGGPRRENFARGDGAPQEQRGERREGERRDGPRRDRERGPRHGGKPFGGKGGDRGRGDRRDKPAPKLYSFESVVDRGFEDVAAAPPSGEAGEGSEATAEAQTRRVDWTIVKRTVADQRAAKTVSALYILKRDGAETEFPNLGAARAAVNKTIVHPEKLTRAKADYPTKK